MNATALMVGAPEHLSGQQHPGPASAECEELAERTDGGPQHMQALHRANRVRLARAELKRRIGLGELSAAEVVRANSWEVQTMAVAELLMSQRRWGHTRARRFLAAIPMAETKTIGSMTVRQRETLSTMLAVAAAARGATAGVSTGRAAQAA